MPDREKVIKGLETCIDRIPGKYTCNECPYEVDGNYCERNLAKDAITLLKEQGPVHCKDCLFHNAGENEVDAWDRCRLHNINVSDDEFCSWAVRLLKSE